MARGGGSRGCLTFLSANSSRTGSALSARVRGAPSHTLALGALRVSGGLLEFLSDVDHQALLLEGA